MTDRRRRPPNHGTPRPDPAGRFQPGDHVRWYAAGYGWPIDEKSLLVEGELDQKYLALASDLYRVEHGRALLAPPFSVFPTGVGDAGGTPGLLEHYPILRALVERDVSFDNRRLYRIAVLVDNDGAGKDAVHKLCGRLATLRVNHDVFLLHRRIPRETRDPGHLAKLLRQANSEWSAMDCEIEDLLNAELLDEFRREDPRRCRREPQRCSGGHHYEFAKDAKSALYRYVAANAMLSDLVLLVELLKSLRFLLGLDPEGEPIVEPPSGPPATGADPSRAGPRPGA